MSGSGLDVGGKSSSQRIASLDGLRTLSIVMVLFGHLWGTNGFPKNVVTEALAQYAHLGVQVFFVISGFLITTLLLREHKSTGRIDLYAFYRRRMFRIFPAAFFYITVMAIVARPGYLWWAYTYLMCYAGDGRPWLLGHLWSLSVEEQFYMVWPLALITWFSRRATVAIAVFLLAPVARLVFWQFGMHSIDEYFPAVADSLAAGCLLAFWIDKVRERGRWLTHPVVFTVLGMAVLAIPFMFPRLRLYILFGGVAPVLIALFLFAAVERADWFLNNRVMYAGGALSYSAYLWQQAFLNRNLHAWWTSFPVNLLLAFAAAAGSYFVVEKPFLKLGHRTKQRSVARVNT